MTITLSYKGKDGTAVSDVTLSNQGSESNLSSAAEFLYDRSTGAVKTVKGKQCGKLLYWYIFEVVRP